MFTTDDMGDGDDEPFLQSVRPMKESYNHLNNIAITSENFTVGRGLKNSVVIPFIAISRNHCVIRKTENNEWILEDHSTLGIKINGENLGKGVSKTLSHGDTMVLEPSEEFVYQFHCPDSDDFEIPKKRIKLEKPDTLILNNVKMKFEESQNCEIKHIENKIQSAKELQNTSLILKQQLQLDMTRKVKNLKKDFAQQIENLKGEKNEVEKQKALLMEERDAQLAQVKNEMEGKIAELMDQIQKQNEAESELLKENNLLKEKLDKEREEFLSELGRESSSKQDMLEKLNAKIREQEEVRLKEKQELEALLRKETEQLRLAKEKELKELEDQKRQRELELEQELSKIKQNLTEQVNLTEQQKLKAEEQLNLQMEEMKKLSSEDKIKMEKLLKEREEIQNQLLSARENAEKSLADLQKRVSDRETELAALAASRIQQHVEQSSEVISTLQEQLEKMKNQLQSVETEKNTILESICMDNPGEGSSKQTLTEVGELMENELQCSICAELFIEATTLNCSHTFCKYCINMWKKKKKDCPICRSSITSENRSLVLDTFIEKMVQNLTEEMKTKRKDILKFRADQVLLLTNPRSATSSSRRRRRTTNTATTSTATRATISTVAVLPSTTTTMASRIPIVDLTTLPIPVSLAERPPILQPPVRIHLIPMRLPQMPQLHGVAHAHQVTVSQASMVRTTEGTAGALVVARAATGPPAAPTDNRHQNRMPVPFILIDEDNLRPHN